jgi:heavy metal translocating P-type ATPase
MPPSVPYIFDEFFASGQEESISPFLTPSSRSWGKNLSLKVALISAGFLLLAFITSFFVSPLSSFLLLVVYFLSGTPALLGAIEDISNFEINIDVLMTLAALLSVIIGSGMEGALLLVLFEFSGAMENMVAEKTKGTLSHLNQLSPRMAFVVGENGTLYEKSVKEISIGSLCLIKAGEVVPLDGIVIEGSSFVNLFHLTGEGEPIPKKKGDEVPAGARNFDGTLTIQVTRTSADSTLSRIIHLITQAQEAKPRLQRFLDRFSSWYAMTIIALFFLFALTIPLLFPMPYFGAEGGIYRALAFLIAASPCALIIATPTAYLSAISSCARRGIILKGGIILDALASCTTIAFDKTGTLTTGELRCVAIEPLTPSPICSMKEALAIAYSLERNAVHPIADAINRHAQQQQVRPVELLEFTSVPGYGLEGKARLNTQEISVYIGHAAYIGQKIPTEDQDRWKALLPTLTKSGHLNTILLVGSTLFVFHFLDTLRPQSVQLIETLKTKDHIKPIMLTGDHADIAAAVAAQVGIEEVHANLRPEDKLRKVTEFAEKGGLMMVGDGINDAPALARATVGISMGKIGSATAVEASDVVFLNDDLFLLSWLTQKSHQTLRIVKQNISLALGVILFATTPALLGWVPLWVAVILHEGGTVLVGLNSLRLLRSKT